MLQHFIDHVCQQHLFPTGQQVLLAVSGGVDSVVLAHLMHSAGFPFAIAHCNFHLRPGDCDRDELFVRQLSLRYDVPFHVVSFNTLDHAHQHHQSVEEAARQLRYDWFRQLCRNYGYPAILTAHHRDDSAETFFINLLRGTGLAGLHGILPRNELIARPLLPFSRAEIESYAAHHNLTHVEDTTNSSLLYRRNQVRHRLLPLLRTIQPSADTALQQTIQNLQSVERLYLALLEPIRQRLVSLQSDGSFRVSLDFDSLSDLFQSPAPPVIISQLLFELLRPFGFNASTVSDILQCSSSGRRFFSATHQAILDRGSLFVMPLDAHSTTSFPALYIKHLTAEECCIDYRKLEPNQALFDADSVVLPLALRHWKQGDRFQPLGMAYGTQLLSDFFSDHKYSIPEKHRQLLLVDANDHILWIVGRRTAHPFRVKNDSKNLLLVSVGGENDSDGANVEGT